MRSVSDQFTSYAQGTVIPLNWAVRMSFDKVFDDDIGIFEIGTSAIEGGDFIKGTGDVVQEWDKYTYIDLSDRVLAMEWEKEVEPFASVISTIAEVKFNNYDNYFTTGAGSEIDGNILPYRPIRIYAGYGNNVGDEVIPEFIGVTQGAPVINEKDRTATFRCIDYLYTLLQRPLLESALYEDQRSDQILTSLFSLAGITSVQLDFDTGYNTINYAYFKKDTKLGEAIKQVLEAENGRLYMTEEGVVTFKTRENYNSETVYRFNSYDSIIDISDEDEADIINVVEIKSNVLDVEPLQKYYELSASVTVPAESSKDIWVQFETPVTSADAPVYVDSATTSYFSVNTQSDGSGTADSTNVTLSSSSLFDNTYKLTFANAASTDRYITELVIFATPVVVIEEIYIREQDDDSVSKYDERVLSIENDFFQNETDAIGRAKLILRDWRDFGAVRELTVKGNFALQIDDTIEINNFDIIDTYKIFKITNTILEPANYSQKLKVRKFTPADYFTIQESEIGGVDEIYP